LLPFLSAVFNIVSLTYCQTWSYYCLFDLLSYLPPYLWEGLITVSLTYCHLFPYTFGRAYYRLLDYLPTLQNALGRANYRLLDYLPFRSHALGKAYYRLLPNFLALSFVSHYGRHSVSVYPDLPACATSHSDRAEKTILIDAYMQAYMMLSLSTQRK